MSFWFLKISFICVKIYGKICLKLNEIPWLFSTPPPPHPPAVALLREKISSDEFSYTGTPLRESALKLRELFQTQTSNIEFYSVSMFEQITKNGDFSLM